MKIEIKLLFTALLLSSSFCFAVDRAEIERPGDQRPPETINAQQELCIDKKEIGEDDI